MKTSIVVQNLKCGGCAKTISSKISKIKNLSDVLVDVESATVSFVCRNTEDVLLVQDKLKALGYPSIEHKNSMTAKAISFMSCATGKMSN